ncbi:MAG: hypothetical protein KKB51_11630 [Candidatus Riflebacteria bacterium]|nr:hypothetical protein [Candidatus Riflebacteria bacterium]
MKKIVVFMALISLTFCQSTIAAPLGGGMQYSGDHQNDPAIIAIRQALLVATPVGMRDEQLSFPDEPFDFLKKIDNEYYVRIGDDFVFVGNTNKPDKIYVSPLFHGNPGTVKLFRHFDRAGRNLYLFSYEYTTGEKTETEYFALDLHAEDTWCTNMIDFQQWDAEGKAPVVSSRGTLRDVRCVDVDHDGQQEILCSIERPSGTDSKTMQRVLYISKLQMSDEVSYYEYRGWKPTFKEIFPRK